jgi:hypothetical protein
MYYAIAVVIVSALAWDILRRALEDRRAAREFDKRLASELTTKLADLTQKLEQRVQVQERALSNFLEQCRELVKFSESHRRDAELRSLGKALR